MSLPTMLNVSERSGRNGSNFPSAALNPPDNNENSVRPNPTLALTRALCGQMWVPLARLRDSKQIGALPTYLSRESAICIHARSQQSQDSQGPNGLGT